MNSNPRVLINGKEIHRDCFSTGCQRQRLADMAAEVKQNAEQNMCNAEQSKTPQMGRYAAGACGVTPAPNVGVHLGQTAGGCMPPNDLPLTKVVGTVSLVGSVVMLRINSSHDKSHSTYHDGEYLVVGMTPFYLTGVKIPAAGADATSVYSHHQVYSFALTGVNGYHASYSYTPSRDYLKQLSAQVRWLAEAPKRGEKAQWVSTIYSSALEVARLIAVAAGVGEDFDRIPVTQREREQLATFLLEEQRKVAILQAKVDGLTNAIAELSCKVDKGFSTLRSI